MFVNVKFCIVFFLIVGVVGCGPSNDPIRFSPVPSSQSNVVFQNDLLADSSLNILSYLYFYNGAGVATADFNNDGLLDLYFTSNQFSDKIYLNNGGLQFEDITDKSGIANDNGWTFGVTTADINSDGLMDIYLSKVGSYKSISGHNLLYINEGISDEGVPKFSERSQEYGLNITAFSTHAAFLDFDLDNDLDLFLLNHSVHPNRSYGKGALRDKYDSLSGDKFFENVDGVFKDISSEVGIHQGRIGYGLALSVGDLNADGYPDIYVGNDFFENDYLYLNDGKGGFYDHVLANPNALGHTTHFSMGNAISDLDNDESLDIVSLDMLPSDLTTYKSSGVEFPFSIYQSYLKNGYAPQYMSNTLHRNNANGTFSEIGFLSGIAATEWSWNVLAADFDLDGLKDLHITNGISRATNDMDFVSFIAEDEIQKAIVSSSFEKNLAFIDKMPEKKVGNFAFRNGGNFQFENVSSTWFKNEPSLSAGSTYADLDNDGDLDLVINNVSSTASVLENLSNEENHFLKLKFEGPFGNLNGIGCLVKIYADSLVITEQNYPHNAYLSSMPMDLNIGVGQRTKIDSLIITWPGGNSEKILDIETDSEIRLRYQDARKVQVFQNAQKVIVEGLEIDFLHKESSSLEFEREGLIPFAKGYEGPAIVVEDVNKDGRSDFYIGGAKSQAGALYIQNSNGEFSLENRGSFEGSRLSEETDAAFLDLDQDGFDELLTVSGGNEFRNGKPLRPRLYDLQDGFQEDDPIILPIELNASVVKSFDIDNDGDDDLVIGSNSVPGEYGKSPANFILENVTGALVDATATRGEVLSEIGLVEDIAIVDLDEDGFNDMVIVGNWMEVTILMNRNGRFTTAQKLQSTSGLWNTVLVDDFDGDGDDDFVVGNWGLNSRMFASPEQPMTLYSDDFDLNGKSDPIVTYYYKGIETPLASKDELTTQMPSLKKEFLSYQSFAEASIEDLFGRSGLAKADKKYVHELASCYFENKGDGEFSKKELPFLAQVSSIHAMISYDFNMDGLKDLFVAGNTFAINTQLGRMDASHGLILLSDPLKGFVVAKDQPYVVNGAVRDIELIEVDGKPHMIVGINNGRPLIFPLP